MLQNLFLLVLFLTYGNCFYTYINQQPLCLNFYSNIKQQRIAYDVIGSNPENMNITIYDSSNRIIRQFQTARDVDTLKVGNRFKICFSTTDDTQKAVSFDIWEDESNKIKQLAKKSDIYDLHSTIFSASNVLKIISEQQKFQEHRQTVHTEILKQTQNVLKTYGVLKVVIIVLAIFIQIIILRRSVKSI